MPLWSTSRPPRSYIPQGAAVYSAVMHKTTVMVDDRKLARVRKLLGTKGIRDTYEAALDEVIAVHARSAVVEQLRTMQGLDEKVLRNVRKEAWR